MRMSLRVLGAVVALSLLVQGVCRAEEELPTPLLAPPLLENADEGEPGGDEGAAAPVSVLATEADDKPVAPVEPTFVLPRRRHPWARFKPGAWRTLRVTTETYDEQGEFVSRSVAVRTERLTATEGDRYEIGSEAVLDVGGRRFPGAVQRYDLSVLTGRGDAPDRIEPDEPATVNLHGQAVPCECWKLSFSTGTEEWTETLYYSSEVSPYVLKRTRVEALGEGVQMESRWGVLRAGTPVLVDGEIQQGWQASETIQHAGGATTDLFGVHTMTVPGGLLTESEVERSAAGAPVRMAVTELVDWGFEPETSAVENREGGVRVDVQGLRPRRLLRLLRRGEDSEEEDEEEELPDSP